MYLFIDTETSGRSTATSRSVQIAWVLTDSVGRVVAEESHIIQPDGFLIEAGAIRVHGISQMRASNEGRPLQQVLNKLQDAFDVADVLIGHNISFDVAILQNDMRAVNHKMQLHDFPKICTMRASTAWCRISPLNGKRGFKWPTLSELHRRCFGTDVEGAHDALFDVQATQRCFFRLLELDVIERPMVRVKPVRVKTATKPTPPSATANASNKTSPINPSHKATIENKNVLPLRSPETKATSQNPTPRIDSAFAKKPPRKITSTLAVNGVCASCSTSFTVTLTRYESSSRCPKCHSLVPFSLDWSLH